MKINVKYEINFKSITSIFKFLVENPEFVLLLSISLLIFSCSVIDLTTVKK